MEAMKDVTIKGFKLSITKIRFFIISVKKILRGHTKLSGNVASTELETIFHFCCRLTLAKISRNCLGARCLQV